MPKGIGYGDKKCKGISCPDLSKPKKIKRKKIKIKKLGLRKGLKSTKSIKKKENKPSGIKSDKDKKIVITGGSDATRPVFPRF